MTSVYSRSRFGDELGEGRKKWNSQYSSSHPRQSAEKLRGDLVEEILSMRSNKKGTRSSDIKENAMVLRVEVLARGGAGGETEVGFDLDVDEG